MFKIISITDIGVNERVDGEYPKWKCHIVKEVSFAIKNCPCILEFVDGGYLRTSTVLRVCNDNIGMTIYTKNSIYYLEKYDKECF